VGRLIDGLAGVPVQGRFGVEGLQVADPAVQEEPDDTFRLGRELRLAVRRRPAPGLPGEAVAVQHGAADQAGETQAEGGKERRAMEARAGLVTLTVRGHASLAQQIPRISVISTRWPSGSATTARHPQGLSLGGETSLAPASRIAATATVTEGTWKPTRTAV